MFVASANASGADPWKDLHRAVVAEKEKIERRMTERKRDKLPGRYILCTNTPATKKIRGHVTEILRSALPRCEIQVLGYRDVCGSLARITSLRPPHHRWTSERLCAGW